MNRAAQNGGEPAAGLRPIAASPVATDGCGSFAAASGAIGFDRAAPAARFETISAEDWGRSIALARATPNSVRDQIRARLPRCEICAGVNDDPNNGQVCKACQNYAKENR